MSATPDAAREGKHRRRALLALGALAALTLFLAARGPAVAFGVELGLLPLALPLAALVPGVLALRRGGVPLALAACGLFVLAVAPVADEEPGPAGYALGLAFGLLLLAYGELVHMTTRHARARKAVEDDALAGDHLDRVRDEALRTLLTRAALAAGLAALAVLLAFLLALIGPARLREAVETRAPLGVALSSLVLMGGVGFYVLVRGARRTPENASDVQPPAP